MTTRKPGSRPLISPTSLPERAAGRRKLVQRFFSRLRATRPRDLDSRFRLFHERVFAGIDCLDCANCCISLGPRITERDKRRLASTLGNTVGELETRYLRRDEDGDWVFASLPCPFLESDRRCSVYEHRPKACREYPHTNQRNMVGLLTFARRNMAVCPAVFEIVELLRSEA